MSTYRTVSEPAVMVIIGVIHVALLAKERNAIKHRKGENLREIFHREKCQDNFTVWQLSWQNEPRGRWTARTHGQTNYFFTQLLSEHEGFQSYLHKIGKARSPDCVFCNGMADDAKYTFFSCERWGGFPQQLYADTELSTDNIFGEMLRSTAS